MIKTDPDLLWREIQASIVKRDEYLSRESEMIQRYHGPAYKTGAGVMSSMPGTDWTDFANHAFENTALSAAKTIHSNPRITITGYADQNSKKEAHYLEEGANSDLRRTNLRRVMQNTWPDFQMFWFVTCTTSEPREHEDEEENPVHTPTTKVIDRRDFFIDVYAKTFDEARLMGHRCIIDHDDLLALAREDDENGWDISAIEGMTKDSGLRRDYDTETMNSSITRNEVSYWEVYVKRSKEELPADAQAEEKSARKSGDRLFNGWIHTLGESSAGKAALEIRKPRPFFGPPGGPYDMHGCYTVPRCLFPLGPITATYHQQRALNEHIGRMIKHSQNARTIGAIDGLNSDDNTKLQNAVDGDLVVVSGLDKNRTAEFKFDGLTEQDMAIYNFLKDLLEQGSGTYAASVGKVTGIGTATENAIAGEGANARQEFVAQRHTDGWQNVIRKRVWFLRNDFRIHFRLDDGSIYFGGYDIEKALSYAEARKSIPAEEADSIREQMKQAKLALRAIAQQTGMKTAPDLSALGNGHTPWHELDIDVDIYSMQRTSESLQQQRLVQGSQALIEMIPLMLGNPQIDWDTLLTKLGDSLNWPDLADILKTQVLQGLHEAQAQAADAAQEQQANQAQGAPQRAPKVPPHARGEGARPAQGPKPAGGGPGLPGEKSGSQAAKQAGVGR